MTRMPGRLLPLPGRLPDVSYSAGRHRGRQQPADRVLRALTWRPSRREGFVLTETYEEWQQRKLEASHPGWEIKVTSDRATAHRGGDFLTAPTAVELRIMLDQAASEDAWKEDWRLW